MTEQLLGYGHVGIFTKGQDISTWDGVHYVVLVVDIREAYCVINIRISV
jgi:hypothetical protein